MTRLLLFVLAFLAARDSWGRTIEQSEVARLAELCKVWGKIKIFNPRASTNPGMWDTALLNTIPLIRIARTSEELNAAYGHLLSNLKDPYSRTDRQSVPVDFEPRSFAIDSSDAQVLRVQFGTIRDLSPSVLLGKLLGLGKRQLIFDLRSPIVDRQNETAIENSLRVLMESLLRHEVIPMPGWRRIYHYGYKTQTGSGSGMYEKFYDKDVGDSLRFRGSLELARPIYFILNAGSIGTSRVAAALQNVHLARILVEGSAPCQVGIETHTDTLSTGATYTYSISESAFARDDLGFWPDTTVESISRAVLNAFTDRQDWPFPPNSVEPLWREVVYSESAALNKDMPLLSLFRLWNVIEHFFPYKHLMDVSWDQTLIDMMPEFIAVKDQRSLLDAILRTNARVQDDHVGLTHSSLQQYLGLRSMPIYGRFLNNELVVTHIDSTSDALNRISIGDRVLSIDGITIDSLRKKYVPLLSVSGSPGLNAKLLGRLLRTNDPSKVFSVKSLTGETRSVDVKTHEKVKFTEEDSLPVYRVLDEDLNVHYMDLTRLQIRDVKEVYEKARNSKYLVLDMRGYPRNTIWQLSPLLASTSARVCNYRSLLLKHPDSGATAWRYSFEALQPNPKAGYRGKIIVLIDDNAISQSEHSCLFLKAMGNTTFIGTPTRGTNGDVTTTVLPGGYQVRFTGLYVSYPDGTELQRRGIIPDITFEPTPGDIASGRDAVLAKAMQHVREEAFLEKRKR